MVRRSPAALSVLLLAVAICSAAAEAAARLPSTDAYVRGACRTTRYPRLCEECLSSLGPAVRRSPRKLARAALSLSADRVRTASTYVTRMTAGAKGVRSSREAGAVRDCLETLRDSVDRLRRSVNEMTRMGPARSGRFAWHLSNVQTWVSAALTDETTCLDSLAQNASPAVRGALRKKVVEVAQVTSNALALVNRLRPR